MTDDLLNYLGTQIRFCCGCRYSKVKKLRKYEKYADKELLICHNPIFGNYVNYHGKYVPPFDCCKHWKSGWKKIFKRKEKKKKRIKTNIDKYNEKRKKEKIKKEIT